MCQKLIYLHQNWLRTEEWASRLGCSIHASSLMGSNVLYIFLAYVAVSQIKIQA